MKTNAPMWPESQTPSQRLINDTIDTPPNTRECMFCLDSEYTSDDEKRVENPVATHVADKPPPPKKQLVLDYGDLFPCDCSVHAHGKCLHQWMRIDTRCPMCKQNADDSAMHETVVEHIHIHMENRTSQPDIGIDVDIDSENEYHCFSDVGRACCYCSAGLTIVMLLMYTNV